MTRVDTKPRTGTTCTDTLPPHPSHTTHQGTAGSAMASPSWSRRRHLRHRACSHCTCIIPAHVWHVSVLLAYIVPPAQRCKQFCESDCNRGLARGDRNQKPLNDRQRTHFRGVRVALGTGYSHGERFVSARSAGARTMRRKEGRETHRVSEKRC